MARRQRGSGQDLKRRTGTRSPKRTFLIVCEGKETEPQYLRALKKLPEVREAVSVDIQGPAGKPLQIVEAAVEAKRQDNEIDEVWCVFDVEAPQEHDNLNEALALGARQRD